MVVDPEHDVRIHLNEAAIAVIGKPFVPGELGEALDGFTVEAEIKDGVHHPRHRCPRTGAHRDEQRV